MQQLFMVETLAAIFMATGVAFPACFEAAACIVIARPFATAMDDFDFDGRHGIDGTRDMYGRLEIDGMREGDGIRLDFDGRRGIDGRRGTCGEREAHEIDGIVCSQTKSFVQVGFRG